MTKRLPWLLAIIVATVIALLPWWRNRSYQRDLYDYGVTAAAVGRLEAGEKPYTDFGTPLQSAQLLANWAVERAAGATFRGLTWGGAVQTVLSLLLLAGILTRRWPARAALLVGTAITVATASQHLIVYYNVMGALCLVTAACATALAPVPRRQNLGWHILLAAALWVGGMTKLNWHLVALVTAAAWPLRAALKREASPRDLAGMLALIGFAGLVLPVATELAWTGASWRTWFYNVVANPLHGSRPGDLGDMLHAQFYLAPPHDFYGQLLIRPIGLLGVLATLFVIALSIHEARRRGDRVDLILAPLAGLVALAAGAGLLATNYDIAVLSLGPWLGLLVAMWLGFDLPVRGAAAWGGLAWPALLLAVSWPAAWQGLRSQFGHSNASRAAYLPGEQAGEMFPYLRGTRLPPETIDSLRALAGWWRAHPGQAPELFYLTGLEWLERCQPSLHVRHRPLWMHFGTSYGPAEREEFVAALKSGRPHSRFVVPIAYDYWPGEVQAELESHYFRHEWGPAFIIYERIVSTGISPHPVAFIRQQGGNLDSRELDSDLVPQVSPGGRPLLGLGCGTGGMALRVPTRRIQSTAVLARPQATGVPLKAHFIARFLREGEAPVVCWETDLELGATETERTLPCEITGPGLKVEFRVTLPAGTPPGVQAGWANPSIQEAVDLPRPPPLRPTARLPVTLDAAALAALGGADGKPTLAIAYGGRLHGADYLLEPEGELWLRVQGNLAGLNGTVTAAPHDHAAPLPGLYAGFYKGGRLDAQTERPLPVDGQAAFHLWSAEPDGWFVLALESHGSKVPVVVRLGASP